MLGTSLNFNPLNETTNITNPLIIPITTQSSHGFRVQYPNKKRPKKQTILLRHVNEVVE